MVDLISLTLCTKIFQTKSEIKWINYVDIFKKKHQKLTVIKMRRKKWKQIKIFNIIYLFSHLGDNIKKQNQNNLHIKITWAFPASAAF